MADYFENNNSTYDPEDPYNMENVLNGRETQPEQVESGYLARQAEALKNRGVDFVKSKTKEAGKKAAAKVGKKIAAKLGKKVGKAAAKEGVKLAAKAGTEAALTSTGVGAIAAVGIEAVDWTKKALTWMGKQVGLKIGWKHIIAAALLILNIVPLTMVFILIIFVMVIIVGICRIPGASLLMSGTCGGLGL